MLSSIRTSSAITSTKEKTKQCHPDKANTQLSIQITALTQVSIIWNIPRLLVHRVYNTTTNIGKEQRYEITHTWRKTHRCNTVWTMYVHRLTVRTPATHSLMIRTNGRCSTQPSKFRRLQQLDFNYSIKCNLHPTLFYILSPSTQPLQFHYPNPIKYLSLLLPF